MCTFIHSFILEKFVLLWFGFHNLTIAHRILFKTPSFRLSNGKSTLGTGTACLVCFALTWYFMNAMYPDATSACLLQISLLGGTHEPSYSLSLSLSHTHTHHRERMRERKRDLRERELREKETLTRTHTHSHSHSHAQHTLTLTRSALSLSLSALDKTVPLSINRFLSLSLSLTHTHKHKSERERYEWEESLFWSLAIETVTALVYREQREQSAHAPTCLPPTVSMLWLCVCLDPPPQPFVATANNSNNNNTGWCAHEPVSIVYRLSSNYKYINLNIFLIMLIIYVCVNRSGGRHQWAPGSRAEAQAVSHRR